MRFIKLIFYSILFFFLLLTAISLFIPSNIRISKATNVYATPKQALDFIKDTTTWKQWHPLYQQVILQEHQDMLTIHPLSNTDSLVLMRVSYGNQLPVVNGFQVYQFESTDSLTIQWYMDFKLSWHPWRKFGSLFYEGTYGKIMKDGLDQLKKAVEE